MFPLVYAGRSHRICCFTLANPRCSRYNRCCRGISAQVLLVSANTADTHCTHNATLNSKYIIKRKIYLHFQTSTTAHLVPSVATFWYPFRMNGHNIFVVIIILTLDYYYLGKWNYDSQTLMNIYILTIIKTICGNSQPVERVAMRNLLSLFTSDFTGSPNTQKERNSQTETYVSSNLFSDHHPGTSRETVGETYPGR